jgi:putative SOS response-associated peptidase YedK
MGFTYLLLQSQAAVEKSYNLKTSPLGEWPVANQIAKAGEALPIITSEFKNIIQFYRWGLMPSWAKDASWSRKLIYTQLETIEEKPWANAIMKYYRCVVPCTHIQVNKTKIITTLTSKSSSVIWLAGLYSIWGDGVETFSIITSEATSNFKSFTDRLPVVLPNPSIAAWLDKRTAEKECLRILKNNDTQINEQMNIM